MPITFDSKSQAFHLTTKTSRYVMGLAPSGHLLHLGWGACLESWGGSASVIFADRAFSPTLDPSRPDLSLDLLPQEFPTAADTDFRIPALYVTHPDGSHQADLRYSSHRIVSGKPPLLGLPHAYVEKDDEADTLEIDLVDTPSGLVVTLVYTVFHDYDVFIRSARFSALKAPLVLETAMSFSLDFLDGQFELLTLNGAWARERFVERKPLRSGLQAVESRRGASSHQHSPFFCLARQGADEEKGEVFGFCLVYSGSFVGRVEVDSWQGARVQLGIQPEGFGWRLEAGESFSTPEVLLVRSDQGLGGMSRTFHRVLGERVARGSWRDRERPILLNNWEATYFSFDQGRLLLLADLASQVGIELFVLDDGWFGHRDDDQTSLGDWVVDRRKLPGGLDDLGRQLRERGLSFGLWFEPEMISEKSVLFQQHPEWCLGVAGRLASEGRHQRVLDLGQKPVQDYLVETLSGVLNQAPIRYVKWDMNRHQALVGHAQILGLYAVLEQLTAAFPAVLFESCSGGGGRFDAGMLYYMPQAWTSDNTDALDRLHIQWGSSLFFPPATMGAHVSAVPNHQVNRTTPIETRYNVARTGAFGYELDLTTLSDPELKSVARQVSDYQRDRRLLQFGAFYRLVDPAAQAWAAWMSVDSQQKEALVTVVVIRAEVNGPHRTLKLRGLNPDFFYQSPDREGLWSGRELMSWGFRLVLPVEDGASRSLRFTVGFALAQSKT